MQQKSKNENQNLKKKLLEIKKVLSEMQRQQEKERLLEHIVERDQLLWIYESKEENEIEWDRK